MDAWVLRPRRRAWLPIAAVLGLAIAGAAPAAAAPAPPSASDLAETGPSATWFLSMPNSRIVLNPSSASNRCPGIDPGRTNAPLSLGYFYGANPGVRCLPEVIDLKERRADGTVANATSIARRWLPYQMTTTATYGDGQVEASDSMYSPDTVLRSATVTQAPANATAEVRVHVSGTPTWDAGTRTLAVTAGGLSYAVALPADGAVSFYADEASYEAGTTSAAPSDGGYVAVALTTDQAPANTLLTIAPPGTSASTVAAQLPDADARDGAAHTVAVREHEDDVLLKQVPRPQSFDVRNVDAQGVTADQVRAQYYKAWLYIEHQILPEMPESGFPYPQLPVSKGSTWDYGGAPAQYSIGFESMESIRWLAYVDPDLAWSAYKGLLTRVRPDGSLGGEVAPTRYAETALILYELTGDRQALQADYAPLKRYVDWANTNLRYFFGSYDYPGEIDANFSSYVMADDEHMAQIAKILGEDADVAHWQDAEADVWNRTKTALWPTSPTQEPNEFYFPGDPTCAPRGGCGGFTMLRGGLLAGDLVTGPWEQSLYARYLLSYDPTTGKPVHIFINDSKGTDVDLVMWGLMKRGERAVASGDVNSWVRDMVKSEAFSEMYTAGGPTGITHYGVFPSSLGPSGLIDFVLLKNGYETETGQPTFYDLDGADGGVSNVLVRGTTLSSSLDSARHTVSLNGDALVDDPSCHSVDVSGGLAPLPESCLAG